MSSSSASNTLASRMLAAVTSSDSGSPVPSLARWSLDPRLARSTGFAPVRSPPNSPQAEGVHGDPRPVELAGLAKLVQQQLLEPFEHPRPGPLGKPPPAGRHRAAAELAYRQQSPGCGGAGHEQDRDHAGPVRHRARRAPTRPGGRGRQQGVDALPQPIGQQPSARAVMAGIIAPNQPNPRRSFNRGSGMSSKSLRQ